LIEVTLFWKRFDGAARTTVVCQRPQQPSTAAGRYKNSRIWQTTYLDLLQKVFSYCLEANITLFMHINIDIDSIQEPQAVSSSLVERKTSFLSCGLRISNFVDGIDTEEEIAF
jgi:hypothetical protein